MPYFCLWMLKPPATGSTELTLSFLTRQSNQRMRCFALRQHVVSYNFWLATGHEACCFMLAVTKKLLLCDPPQWHKVGR
jgi:hypothetical protein